ncbi:MAG TPA: CoA-binding protein, partial [Proteobacteria bacterium]|nr:CoA-binding protein [Pseudomonadota bacterium]
MTDAATLLHNVTTIAVVGCSPKAERPSHQVARYLMDHGFRVVPVNPGQNEILGLVCYPSVAAIPAAIEVDLVDIFRRAEEVGEIVEEAIARRVKGVWMQEGVVNEAAAARA